MLLLPHYDSELYTAGQLAPPGRYLRIGTFPPVEVVLDYVDHLPASLDGHVAEYQRIELAKIVDLGGQ